MSPPAKALPLLLSSLFFAADEVSAFLAKTPIPLTSIPNGIASPIKLRAARGSNGAVIDEDASRTKTMPYVSPVDAKYDVIGGFILCTCCVQRQSFLFECELMVHTLLDVDVAIQVPPSCILKPGR